MSEGEPAIRLTDTPTEADHMALLGVLRAFIMEAVGAPDDRSYAALILGDDGEEIVGGLWGQSRWGTFCIDTLVVPEALRGHGLGKRLLSLAETEARQRCCHLMWLKTYQFMARGFYERCGFEVFGQHDGPGPFYPRYFMRKTLA